MLLLDNDDIQITLWYIAIYKLHNYYYYNLLVTSIYDKLIPESYVQFSLSSISIHVTREKGISLWWMWYQLSQPIYGISLGVSEYMTKISLYEIKQSKSQIR